ncbi:hypothetical protein [Colwellia sp. 20A7]|uniref:hypothetical protein n=1 Tax=Colwellia sp. 20A7 TaxID=2689569 RepID=UPI00135C0E64|nr:hypothetical protein [Colwellia sp. 20A7]
MKPITSASTPILTSMNSPTQAQQINSMQVSPSKTQSIPHTSNDTIATSSQQSAATIKVETNQLTADEKVALKKDLKEIADFWEKKETSAADMVSETQRILAEVAKEQPNLLNKKFDFTNTGDEIDVIDHDLTQEEYNYLKAKLNASDKLIEATDFLNVAAATNKTQTQAPGNNKLYTKEDVVGRIHVMDVIEQAEKMSAERVRITEENVVMKPNDSRSMFSEEVHLNALDIVMGVSISFNVKV